MAKRIPSYQVIEIDKNDIELRKRIVERHAAIRSDPTFWGSPPTSIRKGSPSKKQVIDYFEEKILSDLIKNGSACNHVIIGQHRAISRQMQITIDDLVEWYGKAWRNVKNLVRS